MRLELEGEANDYVGKGMTGGEIAIRPARRGPVRPPQAIAGNTILYGATGGSLFAAGRSASASASATAARRPSSRASATMAAST